MSTYSLEDFYLKTISDKLEKNKYNCSLWERNVEKSSMWFCYTYFDNVFVGKLSVYFENVSAQERLIPLKCDITLDTYTKREYELPWFEATINNIYRYSCSKDLNDENALNYICNQILTIAPLKKSKTLWSFFDKA